MVNIKKAIEDRINKATRCRYSLKNAIGNNGKISVNLALTLFHKQISPVLLYGCSIWSPPNLNHELNIFTDLKVARAFQEKVLRNQPNFAALKIMVR